MDFSWAKGGKGAEKGGYGKASVPSVVPATSPYSKPEPKAEDWSYPTTTDWDSQLQSFKLVMQLVLVTGLQGKIAWQDLKDHMKQAGRVAREQGKVKDEACVRFGSLDMVYGAEPPILRSIESIMVHLVPSN
eukprot:Skav228381  [mRNA]  locus=scaffold1981:350313:353790:+ [translate_table: standard]